MAWTEYTAQTQVIPSGTLKIKIRSEAAAITWPSSPTIIDVGEIESSFDPISGWVQLPTCSFTYQEAFGTGFTYGLYDYIFNTDDVEVRVTLTEGVTEREVFWGFPDFVQAYNDEQDTTSPLRTGTFRCTDVLAKLWSIPLADVINDILDNTRYTEDTSAGTHRCGIRIDAMICSMLYKSGLNASYSGSDVSWANIDEFKVDCFSVGTDKPYGDCYFFVGDMGGGGGAFRPLQMFDSTDADYWPSRYYSCGSFLEALCKSLAVVPRRYYESSRHKIVLECMGRSDDAANATIDGNILSSKIYSRLPQQIRAALVTADNSSVVAQLKDSTGWTAQYSGTDRDVDVSVVSAFVTRSDYAVDFKDQLVGYYTTILDPVQDAGYWDYESAAMTTIEHGWPKALAGYIYGRMAPVKTAIERRYSDASLTVSTVSSVINTHIGQTAAMSLRGASTVFYAVSVKINLLRDECEIMWYQR